MLGAILGDMIGAPYEFRGNRKKSKEFPLFTNASRFTDDSVMTVAVAEALMETIGKSDEEIRTALITSMQKWGRRYPRAGYGGRFRQWLTETHPKPYGSYGNGSAMRVSSAGWLFETLEETRHIARLTAEVTHNHPEGIKGAEATASAIFLARTGNDKDTIRDYITREFDYDLSRTCDEIRPGYSFDVSCQGSVPEAIIAFLESDGLESAIRNAVSLGGDSDTQGAIAGSIAGAMYGVSAEMEEEGKKRLPEDMLEVLERFETLMKSERSEFEDPFLAGNDVIEAAIGTYRRQSTNESLFGVLAAIRTRMHADGHFMIPVVSSEDDNEFTLRTVQTKDGKEWLVAFTSPTEFERGEKSQVISNFIDAMLKACLDLDSAGFVINPWGESFMLTKELIEMIFKADGDVEYHVPDKPITAELLEDGSFLKRATEICNRNRTQMNMLKLMTILRDSWVWIPCNAILSNADYEAMEKIVNDAQANGGVETLVGQTISNQDNIRMVPDILKSGDDFFFPVFTSVEEMGEYGEHFSKIEKHFLEATILAKNNDKSVMGIVINAFSEPFVVPKELFGVIADLPSNFAKPGE